MVLVCLDPAQVGPAVACEERALFDRAVGLVRGVDHERLRLVLKPAALLAVAAGALASAEQRAQRRGRGRVVDDSREGG